MVVRTWIEGWPVYRQLTGQDKLGLGAATKSGATSARQARTETAEKVVKSICPYCAVGCGQKVYVQGGRVTQIEGDPDSPVSRGRLCPKGSASLQLTTGDAREYQVLYRKPYGTDWEPLGLNQAMDMIADRVIAARKKGWQDEVDGQAVRRTHGFASLGGATLDNEENYLIKKLFTALGAIQIENQARICPSPTVPGLGTTFGRGGATTFQQDLQNSDCILIEGSNMAEAHPVGFQWVMEAKARGAKVIHVDPRFSRTSALADQYVPIRAGSDIAFLGAIVNHVLTEEKYFREYVLAYTNASTILSEDFADTEDLEGVFSGLDREHRTYDFDAWRYQGGDVGSAAGSRHRAAHKDRDQDQSKASGNGKKQSVREAARGEAHGSGGAQAHPDPDRDETLQHPRCVFQVLKRHFARYTPEMVEQICGISPDAFKMVCDALTSNSGRDRTTAFVYSVGWTQHTVGVQYIRTGAILQTLLGNMGRPGGGILALRGHASIQGSTDIPTLFDLLPGYLPMPHVHGNEDLDTYVASEGMDHGFWANMRSYLVSLLKAWWGEAATAENDYCYDYLPKLTGSHSTYETMMAMLAGDRSGYFLFGENPAVGSANGRMQRMAMAELDWLVVRDFSLIESATWWKDGPEIETGEMVTEDIGTEVFFMPAAAHTEKDGSFTNTQRMLQWHHQAVEPAGAARSDLWFAYHLGRLIREKLAASDQADNDQTNSDQAASDQAAAEAELNRPVLDLTWNYPLHGPRQEPLADAVLAEVNGWDANGKPVSSYTQLKDDGSTVSGCWIYCGVYADGVNQAARRKPGREQNWVAAEWGWACPANRRVLYNRASADPDGKPWSERKALVWWDAKQEKWTGHATGSRRSRGRTCCVIAPAAGCAPRYWRSATGRWGSGRPPARCSRRPG